MRAFFMDFGVAGQLFFKPSQIRINPNLWGAIMISQ